MKIRFRIHYLTPGTRRKPAERKVLNVTVSSSMALLDRLFKMRGYRRIRGIDVYGTPTARTGMRPLARREDFPPNAKTEKVRLDRGCPPCGAINEEILADLQLFEGMVVACWERTEWLVKYGWIRPREA